MAKQIKINKPTVRKPQEPVNTSSPSGKRIYPW